MTKACKLIILFVTALLIGGAAFAASAAKKPKAKPFTVVIDAGHGGKDHGAVGKKASEKDINLAVALKLKRLIEKNVPDAQVVMTRSTDHFVTLQGRADIANRAQGDLFISIHTNSVAKTARNRESINGASVYVVGSNSKENLAVAQRENAVMMLEDDYTTTYQGFNPNSPESYIAFELIQNQHLEHSLSAAKAIQDQLVSTAGRGNHGVRQAMFWVLVKTGMPAVLVELDFISNPRQERFLSSEGGQVKLAEAIFNGVKLYKASYDREMAQLGGTAPARPSKPEPATSEPTVQPGEPQATSTAPADAIIYKVQFLVTDSKLPTGSKRFKGVKNAEYYRDGRQYKYTVGAFSSMSEANAMLKKIKKKFPDAFVIKTRNGKRVK